MCKKIVDIPEPIVREIKSPEKEEICRVGVVLEEDNKSELSVIIPHGDFDIKSSDGKFSKFLKLSEDFTLNISSDGKNIICDFNDVEKETCKMDSFIRIDRKDKDALKPGSGIMIKGCVAGRGFHWQKDVNFTFAGSLEFHIRNRKIIAVNELPLEDYLACVVTSEMSWQCPPEFIKAQATAARSWMRVFLGAKHVNLPFTICNDDCCQRYQGTSHLNEKVAEVVSGSRGVYVVMENKNVCACYYSKSCGGVIEKCENIFGESAKGFSESIDAPKGAPSSGFNPGSENEIREWVSGKWLKDDTSYCSPNTCPEDILPKYLGAVDEQGKYYRWQTVYSHDELVTILKKKSKYEDIAEFVDFKVLFRGNSGRIHKLRIIYKDKNAEQKFLDIGSQYEIRYVLHDKFLFSSGFVWDYEKDQNGKIKKIIISGAGWGHGAGFCQIGALGMALKGKNYEEILLHYFDKCKLIKAY